MEAHHPRDQSCPRGVHCTPQMLTELPRTRLALLGLQGVGQATDFKLLSA